jgi:hypothetical protein
LADILSSLWQALSGGGQQVQALPPLSPSGQNAPNQPTMPTMQQPSGIAGVLANPAVQGALASYFAGISSPRQMGWGGAIGRAGLAGLGQYGQAAAQQAELPYRQAMTQKTMAEAQQEQAKAQALGNLTGPAALAAYAPDASKYLSIQQTNTEVAKQVLAAHPNEPFAANVAQSIASDTSKPYTLSDAETVIKSHTMAPLEQKGKEAEIASTEAGTLQKRAETLKAQADAELDPVRKQALLANAQKAEAQAKFLGQAKPMTAGEVERAAIAAGNAARQTAKQGTFESKDAFQQRAQKAYDDAYNAEKQRLQSEDKKAKSAVAASPDDPLSLIPEGGTPAISDDGTHGYVDSSGAFHSVE